MRIGCLGGSFDPVHLGHLALARSGRDGAALDRVVLMVAGLPPHKRGRKLAPGRHRVAMAGLAARAHPWLHVDGRETERRGPSWTLETVRALRRERPDDDLIWIIGADNLPELPSWREIDRLLDLADFVSAARPGHDTERALEELIPALGGERVRRLREGVVPMAEVDVSSTDVRRRVREGRPISRLVPPEVEAYIREHGLYADAG